MAKRAAVIVNPSKIDAARLHRAVEQAEADGGWEAARWYETTREDPGFRAAASAIAEGAQLIVAAGGDGTVRAVAETIVEGDASARLGIVPAGTGNLLARNLRIPLGDVEAAVSIAFGAGTTRRIDVGIAELERPHHRFERTAFVVIAGFGVDAGMIANTDDRLKARIGWPAYLGGIVRSLFLGRAFRARLRFDGGRTFGMRASAFMVGNCGSLQGGFELMPDARIDDGALDVLVLRPRGVLGWLEVGAALIARSVFHRAGEVGRRIVRQRGRSIRSLNAARAREIIVRIDSHPEPFEVDGDAAGEIVAARITVRPGALEVQCPAGR